ncbi:MAG: hypothetical protein K8S21_02840 [Gemmatimonadetes bacterium]|nr:hypothetical protein [Gemmatimonadota bacterium]
MVLTSTAAERASPSRLGVAYLLAPLVTVPVLTLISSVHAAQSLTWAELISGAGLASYWFAVIGLPVAYLVELLIVVAVRLSGGDPRRVPPLRAVLTCALVGGLVFALMWRGAPLNAMLATTAAGVAMGAAAGAVFARVRGPAAPR